MNDDLCQKCVHFKRTSIFDLCLHEQSVYKTAEREEYHTAGHMRTRGACHKDAVLLERKQ